jgi:hypothetical protein
VTEPGAELTAVHTAITELAAIVAGARAALSGRSGNQLEMAELDLLSARSAIEKACWEIDFEPPTAGDLSRSVLRLARPVRVPDCAEQPDPQRPRRPGRRAPGQGQCELFSLPATHDERGPAHGTRKGVGCRDRDVDASGQR